jgi:hypothetical protein
MVSQSFGEPYVALSSLVEAKQFSDGVVVMEGDYGGQIYLVARAQAVHCDEAALRALLTELDGAAWDDPDGARVYFERQPLDAPIFGGMGGARVTVEPWIHPDFAGRAAHVRAVLDGQ